MELLPGILHSVPQGPEMHTEPHNSSDALHCDLCSFLHDHCGVMVLGLLYVNEMHIRILYGNMHITQTNGFNLSLVESVSLQFRVASCVAIKKNLSVLIFVHFVALVFCTNSH